MAYPSEPFLISSGGKADGDDLSDLDSMTWLGFSLDGFMTVLRHANQIASVDTQNALRPDVSEMRCCRGKAGYLAFQDVQFTVRNCVWLYIH